MSSFKDKSIIVTGGANGIGQGICEFFAEREAKVIIADIDDQRGIQLQKDIVSKGNSAIYIHCDVSREDDVKKLVAQTIEQYHAIDVLINNAGVSKFIPLFEMSLKEWDEVINTNLRSVFLCSREAAQVMKTGSSIVNIASTRAFMSEENTEAYSASKGGIISITHALARTLGPKGIRVNSISPGWIETNNYDELRDIDHSQHLTNRVGKPEDVARCCLFLCNSDNDFITGENIVLDGGMVRKMIYED
ncbi:SDR family oxidoreductase [Bacillus sp. 31A1R]|uniref:SDR family oxidoreductase n=1 Tax=Robertmurraya mangrovi TaxID=3098077 RepID=A0ABU5ITU1_9BACI|nr:SDR family oxidoreductase [Bacillus sp. 31A1R]MDZ5470565.1 SDR family oxidoreductase [Bacillus sp. 31A1R]